MLYGICPDALNTTGLAHFADKQHCSVPAAFVHTMTVTLSLHLFPPTQLLSLEVMVLFGRNS